MLHKNVIEHKGFRSLDPSELVAVSGGTLLHKDADPVAASMGNPDALAVFGVFDPAGDMTYNGINPWVPDSWENTYYGRTALPSGEAYEQKDSKYVLWDKNGDKIGEYVETTKDEATRVIETTSSGGSVKWGPFTGTSGSQTQTVYLKPAG